MKPRRHRQTTGPKARSAAARTGRCNQPPTPGAARPGPTASARQGLLLCFLFTLWGCTGPLPQREFGASVESLIAAQTANPGAGQEHGADGSVVTGVDPGYGLQVIQALREDVGQRPRINEPMQILFKQSAGGGL